MSKFSFFFGVVACLLASAAATKNTTNQHGHVHAHDHGREAVEVSHTGQALAVGGSQAVLTPPDKCYLSLQKSNSFLTYRAADQTKLGPGVLWKLAHEESWDLQTINPLRTTKELNYKRSSWSVASSDMAKISEIEDGATVAFACGTEDRHLHHREKPTDVRGFFLIKGGDKKISFKVKVVDTLLGDSHNSLYLRKTDENPTKKIGDYVTEEGSKEKLEWCYIDSKNEFFELWGGFADGFAWLPPNQQGAGKLGSFVLGQLLQPGQSERSVLQYNLVSLNSE